MAAGGRPEQQRRPTAVSVAICPYFRLAAPEPLCLLDRDSLRLDCAGESVRRRRTGRGDYQSVQRRRCRAHYPADAACHRILLLGVPPPAARIPVALQHRGDFVPRRDLHRHCPVAARRSAGRRQRPRGAADTARLRDLRPDRVFRPLRAGVAVLPAGVR